MDACRYHGDAGQPAAGLPDDTGRTGKGVCGIEDALTSNDYKQVLRVFNEKSLVSFIASCLGLKDGVYCRKVIALLQGEKHDAIVAAIAPYLPSEIQR